jgi:hypothetical protein
VSGAGASANRKSGATRASRKGSLPLKSMSPGPAPPYTRTESNASAWGTPGAYAANHGTQIHGTPATENMAHEMYAANGGNVQAKHEMYTSNTAGVQPKHEMYAGAGAVPVQLPAHNQPEHLSYAPAHQNHGMAHLKGDDYEGQNTHTYQPYR